MDNPASFFNEARWQGRCAWCGSEGEFEAHHVVYEQELRRRRAPLHDTRNALRLCKKLPGGCHARHHDGTLARLPMDRLTEDNLEFAFEILGEYAESYLRSRYEGEHPLLAWHVAAAREHPVE